MATLNQDTHFDKLDNEVRNAFNGGMAAKKILNAGTTLFRFSGHSGISPWWSDANELTHLLLGAKGYGKGLANYVREKGAVLRLWNPDMYNLIVAKLTQSVYGFQGTIAPQNEASKYMNPKDMDNYKKRFTKSVFFKGGNGQYFIPGLTPLHLNVIVPAGAVNIYDDVDSIIDFLISYKAI